MKVFMDKFEEINGKLDLLISKEKLAGISLILP